MNNFTGFLRDVLWVIGFLAAASFVMGLIYIFTDHTSILSARVVDYINNIVGLPLFFIFSIPYLYFGIIISDLGFPPQFIVSFSYLLLFSVIFLVYKILKSRYDKNSN